MVQTYKYLGVWLSTNRIYNKARQAQANQGQPREESNICTTKITCKVKVPTHHHCIEVIWCYDTASTILRLWTMGSRSGSRAGGNKNAFCKYILNLPPSATNMAVCGELGQLPLHLLWRERILSYWNRLCSEGIPDLLREAFHLSTWMHQTGKTT